MQVCKKCKYHFLTACVHDKDVLSFMNAIDWCDTCVQYLNQSPRQLAVTQASYFIIMLV